MTPFTLGVTAALIGLVAAGAPAQARWSSGLLVAIDPVTHTLTLETVSGPQQIRVAAAAVIWGDHGETIAFTDLQPGDAVAYDVVADRAEHLRMARQFWAVPSH